MAIKKIVGPVRFAETSILDVVGGLFLTILLGLVGYWIYEVDRVYKFTHDATSDSTPEIVKYQARSTAIFQAAILVFLLAALSLRGSRRI